MTALTPEDRRALRFAVLRLMWSRSTDPDRAFCMYCGRRQAQNEGDPNPHAPECEGMTAIHIIDRLSTPVSPPDGDLLGPADRVLLIDETFPRDDLTEYERAMVRRGRAIHDAGVALARALRDRLK